MPSAVVDSNIPAPGHTILAIGQDLYSIQDYMDAVERPFLAATTRATAIVRPWTFMAYTDIQTLRGLSSPVDYGSGIEYANGVLGLRLLKDNAAADETLSSASRPASLQLGLWLNGTSGCNDILSGALTTKIHELFEYLVEKTPAKITYLRVGYEFDNPSFGYSSDPEAYATAFRALVDSCSALYSKSLCRDKIAFVWHSWAAGVPDGTVLSDFYPGDAHVDWIGISIFSQVLLHRDDRNNGDDTTIVGSIETVRQILSFAADHNKPTMIGESTPFGGIPNLSDPWNDWFEPVLGFIDEFDVSMWCYINCDWDSQQMWKGVGFGNTRLAVNETILRLWNQRVLLNPRFQTMPVEGNDAEGGALSSYSLIAVTFMAVAWVVIKLYQNCISFTAGYQRILP